MEEAILRHESVVSIAQITKDYAFDYAGQKRKPKKRKHRIMRGRLSIGAKTDNINTHSVTERLLSI